MSHLTTKLQGNLGRKKAYRLKMFRYIRRPIANWYRVDRIAVEGLQGQKTKFEGKVDAVKFDNKILALKSYTVQPGNLTLHSYVSTILADDYLWALKCIQQVPNRLEMPTSAYFVVEVFIGSDSIQRQKQTCFIPTGSRQTSYFSNRPHFRWVYRSNKPTRDFRKTLENL